MMRHLFKPIDAAILIYLRFFAGSLLSIELINSLTLGDFEEYTAPFHFTYYFFPWIKPWPDWGLVLHYIITILAGFGFALGIRQRLCAILLFLGYTALFLMEKSEYINHLYLYCLIAFWLIWMPVKKNHKLSSPLWYFYLMLFHISVVYFYAGVAKLDQEWLSGNAVKYMLNTGHDYFFTYGGLLFDLLIVPLLLWKRTRKHAFISACLFHLMNVYNFGLATFPWFSIMMTALFFGSRWPRRFTWFDDFFPENDRNIPVITHREKILVSFLVIYCLAHLTIPFRHHLYPGKVSWTEDGHQFSWRMKLRTKTGDAVFYVVDKVTRKVQLIFPQQYLTDKQYRDMIGKPDSMLQFAHYLRDKFPGSAVFASSQVSLNGMPKKEMINNKVDLAREERKLGPYHWVVPHHGNKLADTQGKQI